MSEQVVLDAATIARVGVGAAPMMGAAVGRSAGDDRVAGRFPPGDRCPGGPMPREFEIICEIQPPVAADLDIVREQIAILRRTCDAFLVPDSHLGRATVSSLAVAHEVRYLRGRAMACLNARDRNLLGFRRDLLTARAYGIEELLFVYGDAVEDGGRSDLTVRAMLEEVRSRSEVPPFRVGVTADVTRDLPGWKRPADVVFTQISFDPDALGTWRERTGFEGAVYAGVIVLASRAMAERLGQLIPGFAVPEAVLRDLDRDPLTGVEVAVEQVERLRADGAADGVQLIPARRFRELAQALQGERVAADLRG